MGMVAVKQRAGNSTEKFFPPPQPPWVWQMRLVIDGGRFMNVRVTDSKSEGYTFSGIVLVLPGAIGDL